MRTEVRRRLWWAGFVVYAAVIGVLSVIPVPPKAQPPIPSFDKMVHIVEYFLFSWLLLQAQLSSRWPRARAGWIAILAAVAYGGLWEAVQSQLPYRTAEWMDIAANTVGGVLGIRMTNPRGGGITGG